MSFILLHYWKGLAIFDVFNVKHYVDNINCRHTVAMHGNDSSHLYINIADTLQVLKEMFDKLHSCVKFSGYPTPTHASP